MIPPRPSGTRSTTAFLSAIALAMVLSGCGPTDPYTPFDTAPTGTALAMTESWKAVRDQTPLDEIPSDAAWARPLFSDILQLGPWQEGAREQPAGLDTSWAGFTAFEGTRAAVTGIDSVLDKPGHIRTAAGLLDGAFRRWPVHFQDAPIPHIDFACTGFNYSVFPTPDLLLIGSEFFIGPDHPAVQSLPPHLYPRYMQERMVPEHLAGDALRGWLLVHFQEDHYPRQGQLAEELLYWGKVLFVARCLAPDLPAHDLLDYTAEEWAWLQAHEMQVWMELRKDEFLYTTRRMDIQKWTADAPFTKAGNIPQDSPDRIGWYIGLRWVEDYVRRHPDITLAQLMDRHDVLPFLQAYRPAS